MLFYLCVVVARSVCVWGGGGGGGVQLGATQQLYSLSLNSTLYNLEQL